VTAVNIVQRSGEILVMTDGLGVIGSEVRAATKVSMLPHIPLLVAVRGYGALAHLLTGRFASDVSSNLTLEDFLGFAPGLIREVIPALASHYGDDRPPDIEIYISGFSSARTALEVWKMASTDSYAGAGQLAFDLVLERDAMTAAPRRPRTLSRLRAFACPLPKNSTRLTMA
jgi:hypothetical protein